MNPTHLVRSLCVFSLCLFSLLLGAASPAAAVSQSKAQQKCLDTLSKVASKVSKVQAKEVESCLKNAGRGKLGDPPAAQACFTEDAKGKVAKAKKFAVKFELKKCPVPVHPDFLVPPVDGAYTAPADVDLFDPEIHALFSEALGDASARMEVVLAGDIFGVPIDDHVIAREQSKTGADCQHRLLKAIQACGKTRRAAFDKCKKGALKDGAGDAATVLAACLMSDGDPATGQPDEKGRLDKKCGIKFDKELPKRCAGVDLASAFPGACSEASDFAECADARVACRLCQQINEVYDVSRDCDLFDDQVDNASCNVGLPVCGDGFIDAISGETCDDDNTVDGDGCASDCSIESGWICEGVPSTCHTVCGDGIVAGAEACDDAGESATCDADCTAAVCGDSYANTLAGEACDDGGESITCDADCTPAACGDGTLNPTAAEACDDGGESAACDSDCTAATCGDSYINVTAGEACDDGGESATCDADCTLAVCGDGTVNSAAAETCDDGGESATCDADCTAAACGDAYTNPLAGETCDDGGESVTCDADCSIASCGDGTVNVTAAETCDDAGESATCDANCTPAVCGDGTTNVSAGESCDDAGDSAACDADCSLATCGDTYVNTVAGEACDDGGESITCDADCTPASCGDGTVNTTAAEACDDGGESATCDADCTAATCGDSYINVAAGEACDDGGESITCDADCTPASCGDGTVNTTAAEVCDDAGESATCDANCTAAVCGDSYTNTAAGESCDDGGESITCDADCTPASCGDGTVNTTAAEACDDAGESATCDANCTLATCGDGTTNATAGETCDDAGESATCNVDCTTAACGDGKTNGSAGETCDDTGESATCDDDCTAAVCGDGTHNATSGEACDTAGASPSCDIDCTIPIAVLIDAPSHGTFTEAGTVPVSGRVENVDPNDVTLTVNGIAIPVQPDGTFTTSANPDLVAVFSPVLARATRVSTGAESVERVVVIAGTSIAEGQHAPDGVALRINDNGFAVLSEALLAGAPLDLTATLPPGTLLLDDFSYGFGTADMYVSDSPAPSISGVYAGLDSQNAYVTTNFGLTDMFIRLDIDDGGNGSIDCRLDVAADALDISADVGMEPDANDPHLVDATQVGDVAVTTTNGSDDHNCGGFLGFGLGLVNVTELLATSIQDGLNTPDPNSGVLPMEALVEGIFGGIASADPNDPNDPNSVPAPVLVDSPYSAILEDVAGLTTISDIAAEANPPDPNAPELTAFYHVAGIVPTYGATTPVGAVPYDFGFALSASGLNEILRASTEASPPVSFISELDLGSGPGPITAGALAPSAPAFAALDPNTPIDLRLTVTLAPILTGQAGPSGSLMDLRVAHILTDFVTDPGTPQQDVALRIAVDAQLGLDVSAAAGEITMAVTPAEQGVLSAAILLNPLGVQQASVDTLLPQVVNSIIPALSDALGTTPLPAILDYELNAVEINRSNAYVSIYLELQPE